MVLGLFVGGGRGLAGAEEVKATAEGSKLKGAMTSRCCEGTPVRRSEELMLRNAGSMNSRGRPGGASGRGGRDVVVADVGVRVPVEVPEGGVVRWVPKLLGVSGEEEGYCPLPLPFTLLFEPAGVDVDKLGAGGRAVEVELGKPGVSTRVGTKTLSD